MRASGGNLPASIQPGGQTLADQFCELRLELCTTWQGIIMRRVQRAYRFRHEAPRNRSAWSIDEKGHCPCGPLTLPTRFTEAVFDPLTVRLGEPTNDR
jgi:hypothetical protein